MTKNTPFWFFLFSLSACLWIFTPGLSGGFFVDDFWNITENKWLHINELTLSGLWNAMMSGESGYLKRPLAMLSFALNHWLTGLDPYWMKVTNLIIHLLNSVLLCFVLKEIFRALSIKFGGKYPENLAYIIAGVWTIHPINVTSVSYIVQRMTSLSSFFMLLAMLVFLYLRKNNLGTKKGHFFCLLIIILWGLGLFTKEIVIILGLYILLFEWQLYGFKTNTKGQLRNLYLTIGSLNIPILLGGIYTLVNYQHYFIDSYQVRNFNLFERVLTETRVLIEYIRLIIMPDVTNMGIFQDTFEISTSIISPFSTLFSLFIIIGLLITAFISRNRLPLFTLGVFWFFIGHLLESTVFSLELLFLHRNYVPAVGILFIMTEGMLFVYRRNKSLAYFTVLILLIIFIMCSRLLAWQWSNNLNYLLSNSTQHTGSFRANQWSGKVFLLKALQLREGKDQDSLLEESRKYNAMVKLQKPNDISVEFSSLRTYLLLVKKPPKQLVDAIIKNIQFSDFLYLELSTIELLSNCTLDGDCMISSTEYRNILEGCLKNKNVRGAYRSFLLNRYALYFHRIENDVQKAIEIQNQAIEIAPSLLDNYIKLVGYYMEIGDISGMERSIEGLKKYDRYNMYSDYIKPYQLGVEKAKILLEEHKNIQK